MHGINNVKVTGVKLRPYGKNRVRRITDMKWDGR
jgi:hypothetical protein